ncbi:hypothetical protein Tco_0685487 [Tanacetum coccineum]
MSIVFYPLIVLNEYKDDLQSNVSHPIKRVCETPTISHSKTVTSLLHNKNVRNKTGYYDISKKGEAIYHSAKQPYHSALLDVVHSGLIRGIKCGSSDIILTHLFYVDDFVITAEWSSHNVDNIIRVLLIFYLAAGLKINIHKCNVYGIEVSAEEGSSMANNTGCPSGTFPFVYLGLPIGSNMNLTSNWKVLVNRYHSRLSNWKANLLSIGRRLTLIKVDPGSLEIYYLSILKALDLVLKSIEIIRASFFWGGSQESRKLFWGKCSNVLAS